MELVTFGEAMVRLTPPAFQRLEQAHSFDAYVGGGELNVAVAAARLGIASRWVSRLPDHALGHMIANRAREQGVDAHKGKIHRAPRYEVEVVDRIGSGDAFSAGLIVSRLENHGWEDAARFATATSALKHSIPGDFCLVTRGEVEQLLRGTSLRVSR